MAEKILIIDDDVDTLKLVGLMLERQGYRIAVASNGTLGISRAAAEKPDLILLDVMMPGMDGPTTLRSLRALPDGAGIPVIFLTAKVQPAEVAQLKSFGALDVIAKPFDPMKLSDQVREIWSRHHG